MTRQVRRILVTSGIVLLAASVAAGCVVESGALDRWLAQRISENASRYNVRAEIGSLHLSLHSLRLQLHNVSLTAADSSDPFFTVKEATADLKLVSLLSQRLSLSRLDVFNPVFTVKLNKVGRWNLASLRIPREDREHQRTLELSSAIVSITGGQVVLDDTPHKVGGEASSLAVVLRPSASSRRLELSLLSSSFTFDRERFDRIALEVAGIFNWEGGRAERITVRAPEWRADLAGSVVDWKTLRYELDSTIEAGLSQIGRVLAPALELSGEAKFTGRVSGEGSKFVARGELTSNDVVVSGTHAKKLSLAAAGGGDRDRHQFSGRFNLGSLLMSSASAGELRSPLSFDGTFIDLPELKGTLFGGEMQGTARINVSSRPVLSSVDLVFHRLSIEQLSAALPAPLPLAGTAEVTAKMEWRGFSTDSMTGSINASARGVVKTSADEASIPFNCVAELRPQGKSWLLQSGQIEGANTIAKVSGIVRSDQRMALGVSATMRDLRSAERALRGLGLLQADTFGNVDLAGGGFFKGNVEGTFASPEMSGQFEVEQLALRHAIAGRLAGQIHYSARELRLKSALLTRPDRTSAHLDFMWPMGADNGMSLDAHLHGIDLGFALNVAGPDVSRQTGEARGRIDGELHLTGLPSVKTLRGDLDIRISDGEIRGEKFGEIAGRFSLEASLLRLQNAGLDLATGQFRVEGTVNLANLDYDLNATARHFDVSRLFQSRQRPGPAAGFADISISGKGNFEAPSFDCTITSAKITVNGEPFTSLRATGKSVSGTARIRATARYFDYEHEITGTFDTRDLERLSLSAEETLTNAPLQSYLAFIPGIPGSLSGTMTGTVRFTGDLRDPGSSRLRFSLTTIDPAVRVPGIEQEYHLTNDGIVTIDFSPREVGFESFRLRGEGTNVEVRGALALSSAGLNTLRLRGDVNLQLLTLALSRGTTSRSFFSRGIARLEAVVSGAGADGRLTGTAEISGMSLRWLDLPLALENGQGRILFTANQAELDGFSASLGGGTVTISGGFILQNLLPDRWRYQMHAEQVRLGWPAGARSILDGDLTLQGNNKIQVLSGAITVRRAEYTSHTELADLLLSPSGSRFNPADVELNTPLTLDLRVDARDSLIVRNNFADGVGSGSLHIRGTLSHPRYSGRLTVTRGVIDFRSQRYSVTRGLADLPDRPGAEPYFNVEAETDIRGYRVILTYAGTLSKFTLDPRSEPALPVADVVALITTGNILPDTADKSQLLSQANVGAATSLLSETLTRRIEQQTDRLFGLNRFQLDPLLVGRGTDPTARVTVGRRITRDLTITYSTNVSSAQEQVALIEYRLSDRISLVGLRDERGKFGFDVRFRKRF